ncbi:MFS transporter [Lichenibacterium minor]|jgi:ACS family tartrate transporter-like MFS transporter|uniref:MFS transporter n=1 Tax=Lichenibacterium minor TaxID=2316528 RepID=A0A4Q2U9R7_9HYPH|nr:MFS transporter [Lichenibacterium minor]RYC33563.1 MFS transporter [Lichenibacterium minor]
MDDVRLGEAVVRKVRWRVLPFLILCFFVAFLDRVNVGFAALQMNQDLGFTPEVYGLGAGLFFIGYFFFEIPSNLALHRFGARRWIARILVTWGILAVGMAWVSGTTSFYVMRFLLGAAEAGFFPGVLLYMTYWFPREARARVMATFSLGSVVSLVIGAPVSGFILSISGGGLANWQWLFIVEGVPAVMLGIVTLFVMTDHPAQAAWLDAEEKRWLADTLAAEASAKPVESRMGALATLKDPRAVVLAFAAMLNIVAIYGISLWLPQIVKSVGNLSNLQVGFISALPFLCTAVAMMLNARHSDRHGERRFHILVPAVLGGCGFVLAALSTSPIVGLFGICVAAMGIWCANTVFWTVPMQIFSGVSAAAALGLINSIGNLGGFIGPYLTGWIRQASGGYPAALITLGGALACFGVVVFVFLTVTERSRAGATAFRNMAAPTGADV